MKYLTTEDILHIHSFIIDEIGGSHGVRDLHALSSIEAAPRQSVFGKELYPDIFSKAAVIARNIIMHHPFIDGNKRTGMTAASVFLEDNGFVIIAKEGEIERCALKIISEKLEIKSIALWFKRHSHKRENKT